MNLLQQPVLLASETTLPMVDLGFVITIAAIAISSAVLLACAWWAPRSTAAKGARNGESLEQQETPQCPGDTKGEAAILNVAGKRLDDPMAWETDHRLTASGR